MKDSIIIHNIMFCVLKYLLKALIVNHSSINEISIPKSYQANPYALSIESATVSPIDWPSIFGFKCVTNVTTALNLEDNNLSSSSAIEL